MTRADTGKLRIGVIGCGKVAQNIHLPALQLASRCELVAVCDASTFVAEAVGRRYGIERVYQDVVGVLDDEAVDAVIVSVGDPDHVGVATRALDARKHVLVEKPLGASVAECLPLRDAVARSGKVLQVGVMKRHDPGVVFAKEAIAELGRISSFSLWYRASADRYVDERTVFLPVIRDPDYRRPPYKLDRRPYYLATHGAHVFDLVRFLMGPARTVQTQLYIRDDVYSWHSLVRLADGVVGSVELTVYVESDWSEGLDVFGTNGSVSVRTPNPFFLQPSAVRVFDGASDSWRQPSFAAGNAYLRQLESFAASVLDGTPVAATVDDGIAALELIEGAAASTEAGGVPVELTQ